VIGDLWHLLLAGLAGFGLGLVFFGGLWFTVRGAIASSHPARWLAVSFLFRAMLVSCGFYLATGGMIDRVAACLLAFLATRWLLTWRLGRLRTPAAPSLG